MLEISDTNARMHSLRRPGDSTINMLEFSFNILLPTFYQVGCLLIPTHSTNCPPVPIP
jgi:hypothetical protein